MPSRGYRKGINDHNEPLPRQIYTRTNDADHAALTIDAAARAINVSQLVRAIIVAYLKRQRPELPQARGPSVAALRELTRLGNNLNQLARQANTGIVPVSKAELLACLDQINAAARRLG